MSEDNKTPECLIPALRQYRHNRGDGLVAAYDYDLVNKEIATKDAELARLREALAEIREIWAGSDAFIPVTAPEAYAQHLCKQMYQAAIETLKSQ